MLTEMNLSGRLERLRKNGIHRILMINPQSETHPEQASRFPIGLFSIASFLSKNWNWGGLDVSILDLQTQPTDFNIEQAVVDANPDVVMTTGITPYFPYMQRVGSIVRRVKPEALTFTGGFHTTVRPDETMSTGNFDIGVIGEGEEKVLEVLSAIASQGLDSPEKLFDHKGLALKKESEETVTTGLSIPTIPLDQYPYASEGLQFLIGQEAGYRVFGDTKKFNTQPGTIVTSRGCAYNCANCGSKQMFPKIRSRSPQNVVGEVRYLYDKYGTRNFYFADDTINQDRKRLAEISRLLIEQGLPIEWVGMARTNILDASLYQLAAKSGCVELAFGVESADPAVLERLGKRSDMDNVTAINQQTKDVGISSKFYLMTGNPGETPRSSEMTAEYLQQTHPDKIRVSKAIPYPGAPFLNDIEVLPPYDQHYEDWWAFPPPSNPFGPMLNLTKTSLMSPEEIEAARQLLIKTHLSYGGKV